MDCGFVLLSRSVFCMGGRRGKFVLIVQLGS